jgi:putative addiction module component (TIGR02574 family)
MVKKDDVLRSALDLPPEERADVAHRFWESLDDEPEADRAVVEAEWDEEILRRADELETGRIKGLPAEDVLARLREKQNARGRRKK